MLNSYGTRRLRRNHASFLRQHRDVFKIGFNEVSNIQSNQCILCCNFLKNRNRSYSCPNVCSGGGSFAVTPGEITSYLLNYVYFTLDKFVQQISIRANPCLNGLSRIR